MGHHIADGKGEFIGNVGAGHDDHDIGLIPTNSENRMYVGGGDGNREDLVEAEQTQGRTAARGGDSGSSVYSTASGWVVANGTVTRAGGSRLGFQDFATANRDFGITIP